MRKVDAARNYKRRARFIPTHPFDVALANIGLNSRWKQIAALLVLSVIVYGVYFAQPLRLQKIEVTGMNPEINAELQAKLWQRLDEIPFYNPQRNILFFDTGILAQALREDERVYTVDSHSKQLWQRSFTAKVTPKKERFLVATNNKVYDVYNDGNIKGIHTSDVGTWSRLQPDGVLKVMLYGNLENEQSLIFDYRLISLLDKTEAAVGSRKLPKLHSIAFQRAPKIVPEGEQQIPVLRSPVNADELILRLERGGGVQFSVFVDPRADIGASLDRLAVIMDQMESFRKAKLYYVDVRLEERGFVCLVDAPCAK